VPSEKTAALFKADSVMLGLSAQKSEDSPIKPDRLRVTYAGWDDARTVLKKQQWEGAICRGYEPAQASASTSDCLGGTPMRLTGPRPTQRCSLGLRSCSIHGKPTSQPFLPMCSARSLARGERYAEIAAEFVRLKVEFVLAPSRG
jgi:hypothetical protein